MLTREENELLCRVGPGTLMGSLMRRYWHPVLLASALPSPDADPVRVRLLGEDFVAFRDSKGDVGVLDELCTHRGASLALGRVEDCGLRCLYHGWKFGVDGTIQDTPNIRETTVKQKLKAPAYPVREAAGFIWVYIGPPEKQPAFPNYPFTALDQSHLANFRVVCNVNWVQVVEGGLDSSHLAFLHANSIRGRKREDLASTDYAPTLEIENTDYGFHYAAIRDFDEVESRKWVRIHGFCMPTATMIPENNGGFHMNFHTPLDDTHVAFTKVIWSVDQPIDPQHVERINHSLGFDVPGAFDGQVYLGNAENKWLQDRPTMDRSFSGFGPGLINMEDFSMTNSMGPIFDRSKEHVVPSDIAVVRMRRILLEAARQLEQGVEPLGVTSDKSKIAATDAVMDLGTPWQSAVPHNMVIERTNRPSRMVPVG
jgi:phthalate 4,5-dioxygenase oxygenase subunit